MKKLISIKSDESGENIYFTHKNGVDTIKKDDVIDLKIQKNMVPSTQKITKTC